jgi:hypothetical protein
MLKRPSVLRASPAARSALSSSQRAGLFSFSKRLYEVEDAGSILPRGGRVGKLADVVKER